MSRWTPAQQQAIDAEGQSILVAAAAGSGKTAVLVQRIIRKVLSGIDIDRLLVTTFTNAAAAEMKERVRLALEQQVNAQPDNIHVRTQLSFIHQAPIQTMHAFCLDVMRQYPLFLPIDPNFRIGDEHELQMLADDVLDEVLEQNYETLPWSSESITAQSFYQLLGFLSNQKNDDPLRETIKAVYTFARSQPYPQLWYEAQLSSYQIRDVHALTQSAWWQAYCSAPARQLEQAMNACRQAQEGAELACLPSKLSEVLTSDFAQIDYLQNLLKDGRFEELSEAVQALVWPRKPSLKITDPEQGAAAEEISELRDLYKKRVNGIVKVFRRSLAEHLEELATMQPIIATFISLVRQFEEALAQAKQERRVVDFSDVEHFCLHILNDESSGAAATFRERFDEILVDEYQDTNEVQEEIVRLIARGGANSSSGNVFMVGDVKQSIYSFRLAEPQLFLNKYTAFADGESGLRIDLNRNFRSRMEVIDGVNAVFRELMTEEVAGLQYGELEALHHGATYYPAVTPSPHAVELVVVESGVIEDNDLGQDSTEAEVDNLNELSSIEREVTEIAQRILTMRAQGYETFDRQQSRLRPLRWRDIVILHRSPNAVASHIVELLQAYGIPAFAEMKTGYFEATEIQAIVSLLRIIDNPDQDIPLAAVLRSPMYGFTADELAQIRLCGGKHVSFYGAVVRSSSSSSDYEMISHDVSERLRMFLAQLKQWREAVLRMSLRQFIERLYQETNYYDIAGSMPGGAQRQANLHALLSRVQSYEQTSFRGLFNLIRFIDRLRENEVDLGMAPLLGEEEDVVRIVSTHKSKGLEYPIVFVCGLAKSFNEMDTRSRYAVHKKLGLGLQFVNATTKVTHPTLPLLAIRQQKRLEMLAEEIRIFYVAMTRAQEKLILVGAVRDIEKKREAWASSALVESAHDARSVFDWLAPHVASEERASDDPFASWHITWLTHPKLPDVTQDMRATGSAEQLNAQRDVLEAIRAGAKIERVAEHTPLYDEVMRRLSWNYSFAAATVVQARTSVTELKRMHEVAYAEADDATDEWTKLQVKAGGPFAMAGPTFLQQKKVSAAERGTITHLVMQHIPLDRTLTEQSLEELLQSMVSRQLLQAGQVHAVQRESVIAFSNSETGEQLRQAQWVRRELPFSRMMNDPTSGESVLLQGVIDCLYADESGQLRLIDYKTDRIIRGNYEAAADKHRLQMQLYKDAIEQIVEQPVVERSLFFLDGARFIQV